MIAILASCGLMALLCDAQIEQKKRDKAKRAASKEESVKPLFEEDGKRRGLLDKYDEEEDTGMDIDESGAFTSEKARQQAEIRAKLAAGMVLFPCSHSGIGHWQIWCLHQRSRPSSGLRSRRSWQQASYCLRALVPGSLWRFFQFSLGRHVCHCLPVLLSRLLMAYPLPAARSCHVKILCAGFTGTCPGTQGVHALLCTPRSCYSWHPGRMYAL